MSAGRRASLDKIEDRLEQYRELSRPQQGVNTDVELLKNLDKLHTTELGVTRIKRNLSLDTDDVAEWCKSKINSPEAVITRNGKNWYVNIDNCIITVNAYSYTIITAHKEPK